MSGYGLRSWRVRSRGVCDFRLVGGLELELGDAVVPAEAMELVPRPADASTGPQQRITFGREGLVVGADDGHEIEVVAGLTGTERVVDAFVGSIEEGQVVEVVRGE